MKIKFHYLQVLFLILLLPGCTSMEAVQKYAFVTQESIESVRPVAKDFHLSCTRANSYKPLAAQSKCEAEQEASKAIILVANVLDEYAAALGALAADELVSYDADISAMTTEMKNLKVKGLDDNKIDAVGNVSKLISKWATTAYQQKKVGELITESDGSITVVTGVLANLIETNYVEAIDLEISAWSDGYKMVERVVRTEKPLEWLTYSKAQWKDRSELEAKLVAVKNLAKNIREIGSTHAQLKNDAAKLTSKEVSALVRSFIKDTKPVIKDIQDAF